MFNYEFYDREQLYAEVWAEPVTTVAARYGVSDVMLKKACKKLKVPTPGRGYWQKVKAGARLARPPLPKYDGRQVMRTGNTGEYADNRRRHETVIAQTKPEKTGPAIKVSGQLRNPYPLVEKAQERFKELWSASREKDPVVHLKANYLNIRVAKSSAHRALRIMDAVVKALTGEGHRIGFQESAEADLCQNRRRGNMLQPLRAFEAGAAHQDSGGNKAGSLRKSAGRRSACGRRPGNASGYKKNAAPKSWRNSRSLKVWRATGTAPGPSGSTSTRWKPPLTPVCRRRSWTGGGSTTPGPGRRSPGSTRWWPKRIESWENGSQGSSFEPWAA